MIDLRSDTVTKPTPAMIEAMAIAEVGDDVYGEDPTVNKLQELSAEMLGTEAALFVPSGTMGNLASVLAHCNRGDEIILGKQAHIFMYEAAGPSALGGIQLHTIPNQPDGKLSLRDIHSAIRAKDAHQPPTTLVTIENTHNRCGGAVLDAEYTNRIGSLARENGLAFHIDGARIFNAAAALEVPVSTLVESADSVTFCLSKGLSAPVGSVICGSASFIKKAHRIRKQLGGGMRQAGVLAAAGIVALQEIAPILHKDHKRAKQLAHKLKSIENINLDVDNPPSNMVYLTIADDFDLTATEAAAELRKYDVQVGRPSPTQYRLVVHHWIRDEDIENAVSAFQSVFGQRR